MRLREKVIWAGFTTPRNPVCMSPIKFRDRYINGTFIGLGLTNQKPDWGSSQLMETKLTEDRSCGKHDNNRGLSAPHKQICYNSESRAAACVGDTGSPIVYKKNGEVVCLIGVSIYNGDRCDNSDYKCFLFGWKVQKLGSRSTSFSLSSFIYDNYKVKCISRWDSVLLFK